LPFGAAGSRAVSSTPAGGAAGASPTRSGAGGLNAGGKPAPSRLSPQAVTDIASPNTAQATSERRRALFTAADSNERCIAALM
jgi:hypothetical protein